MEYNNAYAMMRWLGEAWSNHSFGRHVSFYSHGYSSNDIILDGRKCVGQM